MRFYYLTLTLIMQALNLVGQPIDVEKLSSEQKATIQNQGIIGIQSVFKESEIEIQDLSSVEAFAIQVVLSQINDSSTAKLITENASSAIIALAEIAISEDTKTNYVIEYTAAGIARGLLIAAQDFDIGLFEAIKAAANGSVSGAIQFSVDSGVDINKSVSAVGSGYVAGTMETSRYLDLNIINAIKACSHGLIFGTVNTALNSNSQIYESLTSTCEGIAEAAVEASVREELDIKKHITVASIGAGESAVQTATILNLEIDRTQKAIYEGLRIGISESIPGRGNNVRIIIAPVKDFYAIELIQDMQSGIDIGGIEFNYLPIIETPFEDDPSIRQISPIE